MSVACHPIATGVTTPVGVARVPFALHGLPEGTYTIQVIETTTGQIVVEVPAVVETGQNPPLPDITVPELPDPPTPPIPTL